MQRFGRPNLRLASVMNFPANPVTPITRILLLSSISELYLVERYFVLWPKKIQRLFVVCQTGGKGCIFDSYANINIIYIWKYGNSGNYEFALGIHVGCILCSLWICSNSTCEVSWWNCYRTYGVFWKKGN